MVSFGAGAHQAHYIHITEVILPLLCSYMSRWGHWSLQGQSNIPSCTSVTPQHVSDLLGHILCIIQNHLGDCQSDWMKRLPGTHIHFLDILINILYSTKTALNDISVFSQSIICRASSQLLKTSFLPLMEKLRKKAEFVLLEEEKMKSKGFDISDAQLQIQEKFTVLVRDLYAFYPILITYVDSNR